MRLTNDTLRNVTGRRQRFLLLLRAGSIGAALVLTTLSATGLATDPPDGADSQGHHLPGAATVAAIHRWLQVGKASWYGLKFQGRKTATGEVFDMNDLTCAHRSLPLGSWVRVTNLRNRKSVVVRVNDRGPMSSGRIVDLSYAAAHAVGINGVAQVKIEPAVSPSPVTRPLIAQVRMPPSLIDLPIQQLPMRLN